MMIMSTIRTTFLLSLLAVLFVMIGSALGGRLGMIIALFIVNPLRGNASISLLHPPIHRIENKTAHCNAVSPRHYRETVIKG